MITLPRETWLKLAGRLASVPACLLASVIMHIGLVLVCWWSLQPLPIDNQLMVVALVERPMPVAAKPLASTSAYRAPKATAAPRRGPRAPVSMTPPAVETQSKLPQDVVPVAVDADAPSPGEEDDTRGGSPVDNGEGTGWGVGQGADRARRGAVDRLIKATPREEFNATPDYPDIARESRWEGTARVRAKVTAAGDVESVFLEQSSGHAMLDRSALDSVRQWRFIPATRNGVPVAGDVSVQVPFKLTK